MVKNLFTAGGSVAPVFAVGAFAGFAVYNGLSGSPGSGERAGICAAIAVVVTLLLLIWRFEDAADRIIVAIRANEAPSPTSNAAPGKPPKA